MTDKESDFDDTVELRLDLKEEFKDAKGVIKRR